MVGSQSEELSKDEMEKMSQLSAGANARESPKSDPIGMSSYISDKLSSVLWW